MTAIFVQGLHVLVDAVAPIGFGVFASISNVRHHSSRAGEQAFWIPVGIAALLLSLLVVWFVDMVVHPQPEGLATFALLVVFPFLSLPGSIVSVVLSLLLFGGIDALNLDAGVDIWMMAGAIAWQFFIVTGIRWLVYADRRRLRKRPQLGS